MTIDEEMARLRKELSEEQDRFECISMTPEKLIETNETCGLLRRKIRQLKSSMYGGGK